MRRYVSIILREEYAACWETGFWVLGREIARQMRLHKLREWPELVHAEEDLFGWKLVFAWPEGSA